MNGTTMLGQSKNAFQAEIDSACELIDFLRFNVHFLSEIYKQQPISVAGHAQPDGVSSAGRICFSCYAIQLYSYWR